MLNLVTFEPEDAELLESSYNAIRQKDCLKIIVDEPERKKIFLQTINSITIPINSNFTFQNLFKLSISKGHFYIAQSLIDFGYPVTTRLAQSSIHEYEFQTIGIANLKIDLGKTQLRPETNIDKLVGRFFDHDIDFEGCEKFNDKYYLVSNSKKEVYKTFDKSFVKVLSKYDNVLLTTKNYEMYISFHNELEPDQARAVEDIFSNFNFLAD